VSTDPAASGSPGPEQEGPRRSAASPIAHPLFHVAAVLSGYLALAVVATWPLARHAGDHVFGHGTPPLNVWAIGFVLHQLPRDPAHLFDGNVFYPHPDSLAFSEHLFVPALQAAPVVWATGNLVLAHNLVALLTMATAGLGAYLLARTLTGDAAASFAAGVLYAFHTWNVNELIRLQILSSQWFPFLLLALVRFFARPGWGRGALVGLAFAAQSLSCMYWALYAPLLAVPAAAWMAWRHRTPWRQLAALALPLGLAATLSAVFAWPYVENGRRFGFSRAMPDSVGIDRYWDVLPGNLLYERALGTANSNQDAAHFLGFTALAAAVLGAFAGRFRTRSGLGRGFWVTLALAGLALGLGPRVLFYGHDLGPGPYRLLFDLAPGFRGVRYPERFSLFAVLALVPLMAAGLARVREAHGLRLAPWAAGLLFLEHLSIPLPLAPLPGPTQIPEVYRWLGRQDDVRVVADVPAARYRLERLDALPMYFSTAHWKPTVQGFTGYFPPTYHFTRWRLFHFPAPESVAFLRRFGVDTLVVQPGPAGPPPWAMADARWETSGPFAGGHVVLRLSASSGPAFPLAARPPLRELDRAAWKVQGSYPHPERAVDGDPATAWGTGQREQVRGDFYRIGFPRPVPVARVSLATRGEDFPMQVRLLGETPDQGWIEIPFDQGRAFDGLFAQLLHRPLEASLDLDLTPQPLRGLRIRIAETDAFAMPWALPEVRVYEAAP
jgi:hypothetical protein